MRRMRTGGTETRRLSDLEGIGNAMLADLELLEVHDVATLAKQDPSLMYDRLCKLTGVRQDPCVLDVFSCAVAQARDPDLPGEQRKWWWWSRARKASTPAPHRLRRGGAFKV
jgi:hypothetical protein